MNSIKGWITTCLLVIGCLATAQTSYRHVTSSSNTRGHITSLNHSEINQNPKAILIVTQEYGRYNNHQVGVWYNNGTWTIYNEDKVALPAGTAFKILILNPSSNAFVHRVAASNMKDTWTLLDHPLTNNNPDAIVFITQNWKGVYNPKPLGVWYDGSRWSIFNQDNSKLPNNLTFNVLVLEEGYNESVKGLADVVEINPYMKQNQWGDYLAVFPFIDRNSNFFITQNWNTNGPYNAHIPAVWYTGNQWCIYNQDKIRIADGVKFNMLAFF